MLIKRITLIIYSLFFIIGMLLYFCTSFNYSVDIIIAALIPISILLPDLILYRKSNKKTIFNNYVDLMNECLLANSTIDFFKEQCPNISSESLDKHFNAVDLIYHNLLSCDSFVYIFNRSKFLNLIKDINLKYSSLKISNSTLKYCLSKYSHDKSFNSQFVENKYFDELNRQLDIMHSIYDELVSILNCSSKDIFNLREREDYDYQYNCFISAIEQEKMRARI